MTCPGKVTEVGSPESSVAAASPPSVAAAVPCESPGAGSLLAAPVLAAVPAWGAVSSCSLMCGAQDWELPVHPPMSAYWA